MRENVEWCIKKAEEAMRDYNQPAALDYMEMAKLWLSRMK
ncbi:hypothetical protein HOR40_gp14 [Pectobacterium phage PP74]|uniref:Uncharacterized protein n=1 Tax=Pectobacterium phage PP74 TaxID=1916101 RepID=A0A1J0MEL7_9CAUD|nr:hypothetical protein HOR40_gp14 [Pectobacterium phage PP74]APD19627.1 hypothetical protein PP74_14 [Pectobacterium phage PP74]